MFGHQDDKKDDHQPISDLLNEPALKGMLESSEHHDDFNPALPPTDDQPQPAGSSVPPLPLASSLDDSALNDNSLDDALDVDLDVSPTPTQTNPDGFSSHDDIEAEAPIEKIEDIVPNGPTTPLLTPSSVAPVTHVSEDLLSIKQQALERLSPLVDKLDQSPEEKFQTTMMMIQANDNQELVKVAYEAAQAITDEKAKAKALLDIINEINYFTQQSS